MDAERKLGGKAVVMISHGQPVMRKQTLTRQIWWHRQKVCRVAGGNERGTEQIPGKEQTCTNGGELDRAKDQKPQLWKVLDIVALTDAGWSVSYFLFWFIILCSMYFHVSKKLHCPTFLCTLFDLWKSHFLKSEGLNLSCDWSIYLFIELFIHILLLSYSLHNILKSCQ